MLKESPGFSVESVKVDIARNVPQEIHEILVGISDLPREMVSQITDLFDTVIWSTLSTETPNYKGPYVPEKTFTSSNF